MSGAFRSCLINQGVSWWICNTLGVGGVVSLVFFWNEPSNIVFSLWDCWLDICLVYFFVTLAESSYSLGARSERDATIMRDAIRGWGTQDTSLIEMVCSRTTSQLQAIRHAYNSMYQRSLDEDISSDTSGDYRKVTFILRISYAIYFHCSLFVWFSLFFFMFSIGRFLNTEWEDREISLGFCLFSHRPLINPSQSIIYVYATWAFVWSNFLRLSLSGADQGSLAK